MEEFTVQLFHGNRPASAVLMAKLSAYDSDVHLEVPAHDTYLDNQVIDQAQRKVTALYCGRTIVKQHDALSIIDTEETLELAEESSTKPFQNQNAPEFMEFIEINNLKAQLKGKDTTINNLKKHIANLKGKTVADYSQTVNCSRVIAPGMYKLDLEPLSPKLRKNMEAHVDYIKKATEHAETLHDIVEQARVQQPLNSALDYACKFTTPIQELLVYVSATCPSSLHVNEKLVAITPMKKGKNVRFEEPKKSTSNTPTQANSQNSKITNQHLLSSTGVKCSTSTSGS
ncbi:hypothetical protein Tco_0217926 [Tanacetum coccineum]